jgi:hypothetical protein
VATRSSEAKHPDHPAVCGECYESMDGEAWVWGTPGA